MSAADSSALQADLAEFQKLRDEITTRMQLVTVIVGANLTALGTGLSVFDRFPDVLLGLAAVSCFLWLLWLDHAQQVHKIAAYIGRSLAPRVQQGRPSLLGWERYLRVLDGSDEDAARALYGESAARPARVRLPRTTAVGYYIAVLFAGSPLVLLSIYVLKVFADYDLWEAALLGRLVGAGAVGLLFVVAGYQYWAYLQAVEAIATALRSPVPTQPLGSEP